jgi:hypothetical protein
MKKPSLALRVVKWSFAVALLVFLWSPRTHGVPDPDRLCIGQVCYDVTYVPGSQVESQNPDQHRQRDQ